MLMSAKAGNVKHLGVKRGTSLRSAKEERLSLTTIGSLSIHVGYSFPCGGNMWLHILEEHNGTGQSVCKEDRVINASQDVSSYSLYAAFFGSEVGNGW